MFEARLMTVDADGASCRCANLSVTIVPMEVHEAEVFRRLRTFVEECGSQSLAASAFDVSPQYLSKVLKGQKHIGPSILKKLDIRRAVKTVITYTTR